MCGFHAKHGRISHKSKFLFHVNSRDSITQVPVPFHFTQSSCDGTEPITTSQLQRMYCIIIWLRGRGGAMLFLLKLMLTSDGFIPLQNLKESLLLPPPDDNNKNNGRALELQIRIGSLLGPHRRCHYQKWGVDPSAETIQDCRGIHKAIQRANIQDV